MIREPTIPGGILVARYTFSPEHDVKRNWSAWIGQEYDTGEDAIEGALLERGVDEYELESRWEDWQDTEFRPWHHRDYDDYTEFLRDQADDAGVDVRYNEAYGKWQLVHHEGLSVWPLSATNTDDALSELYASTPDWHGFGSRTVGKVNYLGPVSGIDNLHMFEAEDVAPEV